jgi:hypothetical protein
MRRSIALDASSVALGWVLMNEGKPRFGGTYKLTGSIGKKCLGAYTGVLGLLDTWPGTLYVAIESPASRFKGALIPQARVSGAIFMAAEERGVRVIEVAPTAAKKAATGKGTSDKVAVMKAVAPLLMDPEALPQVEYREVGGKWRAYLDGEVLFDEDEADACGVGLAANQKEI